MDPALHDSAHRALLLAERSLDQWLPPLPAAEATSAPNSSPAPIISPRAARSRTPPRVRTLPRRPSGLLPRSRSPNQVPRGPPPRFHHRRRPPSIAPSRRKHWGACSAWSASSGSRPCAATGATAKHKSSSHCVLPAKSSLPLRRPRSRASDTRAGGEEDTQHRQRRRRPKQQPEQQQQLLLGPYRAKRLTWARSGLVRPSQEKKP